MEAEVFEKVRDILAEVTGLEKEEISSESRLMQDLGIESFDIVDLNLKIEEVFDIDTENTFLSIESIVGNPKLMDENNSLTRAGVLEMKSKIPSLKVSEEMMKNGIPVLELLNQIMVKDLVSYIIEKKAQYETRSDADH